MGKQGVLVVNPWEEASGLDPEAVHNGYCGSKIEDFRHHENRRFSNDLIAWGGQAAIVGLVGIALLPT